MSGVPGAFSREALLGVDLDDRAETAESIDEFLGAPLASSILALEGAAMAATGPLDGPPEGFGVTTGLETLRESFENRSGKEEGAGLAAKEELARGPALKARGSHRWRQRGEAEKGSPMSTHPGLRLSGVVAPEESLL